MTALPSILTAVYCTAVSVTVTVQFNGTAAFPTRTVAVTTAVPVPAPVTTPLLTLATGELLLHSTEYGSLPVTATESVALPPFVRARDFVFKTGFNAPGW